MGNEAGLTLVDVTAVGEPSTEGNGRDLQAGAAEEAILHVCSASHVEAEMCRVLLLFVEFLGLRNSSYGQK